MKKLPIGIQDFEKIINDNYLYVDKTKSLWTLINSGEYFFLSRPRRFGKSLLISTLEQIFKGNKELFKGLFIYDKIDWKEHPVIRLDFTRIDSSLGAEKFTEKIKYSLDMVANDYKIKLMQEDISSKMQELIIALSKINKVVILVDEYDKPISDYITDFNKSKENRDIMRQLYAPLKGLDKYIKFFILTGVSRFAGLSVFSGLNNLKDITFDGKYSDLCGITDDEIDYNFCEYANRLAEAEDLDISDLRLKIRDWYNGYSWDGKTKVYNPFSLLNLFDSNNFKNYWFTTGTPTFLMDLFRQNWTDISDLEKIDLDSSIIDSYDIGQLRIMPLLLQTGYLTVKIIEKSKYGIIYHLGYPNYEVRESMVKNLMMEYGNMGPEFLPRYRAKLEKALVNSDMVSFTKEIQSIFAGIPSILQDNQRESYYHSMFYLILRFMEADIDLEVLTDKGRVDAVLKLDNKIFIIEFKLSSEQEAMNQIKQKKYYEKYIGTNQDIYLLAVGGFENKNIKCLLEKI